MKIVRIATLLVFITVTTCTSADFGMRRRTDSTDSTDSNASRTTVVDDECDTNNRPQTPPLNFMQTNPRSSYLIRVMYYSTEPVRQQPVIIDRNLDEPGTLPRATRRCQFDRSTINCSITCCLGFALFMTGVGIQNLFKTE